MFPLKYLRNFWRTLKMPLISCKINLIITWSETCVRSRAVVNRVTTFATTDTKLYAPLVALPYQDKARLLQHLKPGSKRTINCIRY